MTETLIYKAFRDCVKLKGQVYHKSGGRGFDSRWAHQLKPCLQCKHGFIFFT